MISAIRVLIAAEVRFYAEGLALLLDRDARFDVLGTVRSGAELRARARLLEPDVVLLDLEPPGAVALVRALVDDGTARGVIALAVQEDEGAIVACAEAGASGFVTRESSLAELMNTIESAARGELRCSPRVASVLMRRVGVLAAATGASPARDTAPLTAREREVLELVERGLSNKEIAQTLSIELATVKNHVHNLFEKLNVHRRSEAARLAAKLA